MSGEDTEFWRDDGDRERVLLRDLCCLSNIFSDFKYPEIHKISPKRNLLCENTVVQPKKRLKVVKKKARKGKKLTEGFEAQGKKPPKHHGSTRPYVYTQAPFIVSLGGSPFHWR